MSLITSQLGESQLGATWLGGQLASESSLGILLSFSDSFLWFDSQLEVRLGISFLPILIEFTDVIVQSDYLFSNFGLFPSDQLQLNDYKLELITGGTVDLVINEQLQLQDSSSDVLFLPSSNLTFSFSDIIEQIDNVIHIATGGTIDLLFNDNWYYRENDAISILNNVPWLASDTLGLNDANGVIIQYLSFLQLLLNDSFFFGDFLNGFTQIQRASASDSFNFSDSTAYYSGFSPNSYSDQLSLSDLVALILTGGAASLNDSVSLSDNINIQLESIFEPLNISIVETFYFNDILTIAEPSINLFTESFFFQDNAIVALETNLTDYLRRYLNDIINTGNAA